MRFQICTKIFCLIIYMCVSTRSEDASSESLMEGTLNCNTNEFECLDESQCIQDLKRCDGVDDCPDGSDETTDCFLCDEDTMTVHPMMLCDGYDDCWDRSDETHEGANCTFFECTNGKKISTKQVCDGLDDCEDKYRSDECGCQHSFNCTNKKCIDHYKACDGEDDCGDGSDEEFCEGFKCDNGAMVDNAAICDGKDDCGDTTDECPCDNSFTCANARCVLHKQLCDGVDDCGDTSDECKCLDTFVCDNGRCIPSSKKGDGNDDCLDGSDEKMVVVTTSAYSVIHSTTSFINESVSSGDYEVTENPDVGIMTSTMTVEEFTCVNGRAVESHRLCDGIDDCEDGYRSDECGCEGTFTCKEAKGHSKCIPNELLCNGYDDCNDGYGTDECKCDGTFVCSSTFICVGRLNVCDGNDDCGDGSDEVPDIAGCDVGYSCRNGRTVSLAQRCNGVDDCRDGIRSDECGCLESFECDNGKCIDSKLVCDAEDHCGDCSDEIGCKIEGSDWLSYNMYQCTNGTCIREIRLCDGVDDCLLKDDESDCDYDTLTTVADYDDGAVTSQSSMTSQKFVEAEEGKEVTKPPLDLEKKVEVTTYSMSTEAQPEGNGASGMLTSLLHFAHSVLLTSTFLILQ